MPVTVIVGAQWGDEGKGRIVDYVAQSSDLVIRFQGGDNAGHTVVNSYGKFPLHIIPSGIFNPKAKCIIGAGTVVNPDGLLGELALLEHHGVDTKNLFISKRAHLTFPFHRLLDGIEEIGRGGKAIGTTKKGIGPTYEDKAARRGIRVGDLLYPEYFKERVEALLLLKNKILVEAGDEPYPLEDLLYLAEEWRVKIGHRIIDSIPLVKEALLKDQKILLEGQLGIMRDLDWGIYPYVTSSNPSSGGVFTGAGLPPGALKNIVGVTKVYTTAVGAGPFPVLLENEEGEALRRVGQEYGATTGRPRLCGWFDAVAIRYSAWLNGFTEIAFTKLDVLDDFETVKICVAYKIDDEIIPIDEFPDTHLLEKVTPVYEEFPGWRSSTKEARCWNDLPREAKDFLSRLEELTGCSMRYISVGPERDQLVTLW